MNDRVSIMSLAAGLALVAAACGGAGHNMADMVGEDATRTIAVEMVDIAFRPTSVTVKKGETVEFSFTNAGKVAHDAFVGDEAAQASHEQEMRAGGGRADHGGMKDAITVQPGKSGTLTYTFDEGGEVLVGCHQPGHYAAGMKASVTVA